MKEIIYNGHDFCIMARPRMKPITRKVWKVNGKESLVTTVPDEVARAMLIEDGHWLIWQIDRQSDKAVVTRSITKPK
jgi:hypothetical protein